MPQGGTEIFRRKSTSSKTPLVEKTLGERRFLTEINFDESNSTKTFLFFGFRRKKFSTTVILDEKFRCSQGVPPYILFWPLPSARIRTWPSSSFLNCSSVTHAWIRFPLHYLHHVLGLFIIQERVLVFAGVLVLAFLSAILRTHLEIGKYITFPRRP